MEKRLLLYTFVSFLLVSIGVSCNKDDDDDDSSTVATYTSSSTAITAFNLIENSDILANLDSIYFTIDLEGARIYNADSLPKGTDISRMLVEMSYPSCHSVTVAISNAERMNDTTFTYSNSDTIDFTGDVKITVVALDQVTNRVYDVKVNVHQLESDSLQWGDVAYSQLPSMFSQVTEQKTVEYNGDVYCMMADYGYFVMASADSPTSQWSKTILELPFTPDVRSLTAGPDGLYILDAEHNDMYKSENGIGWTSCGRVQWSSIIGAYGDRLLGVMQDGSTYYYDEYPRRASVMPTAVDDAFPVSGQSNMINYENSWGTSHVGIFIGGTTSSDQYVSRAWGYDGNKWAEISNQSFGDGRKGMSLVAYTTYDTNTTSWNYTAYPTLMAWGGRTADGEVVKTLYVSRDMGVNWAIADSIMLLPDYIPVMYNADALVFNTTMTDNGPVTASVTNTLLWRPMPSPEMPVWYNTALPAALALGPVIETRSSGGDGIKPVTEWEVPYIYMFGGNDQDGNTYDTVWRGVINRLTYKPVY